MTLVIYYRAAQYGQPKTVAYKFEDEDGRDHMVAVIAGDPRVFSWRLF